MKLDLHLHTRHSMDSLNTPEAAIRAALKRGLDGIAITDHNTTKGWEEAKKAARKLGAKLVLGEEIMTPDGEVLGLFLKRPVNRRDFGGVIEEIKKQGGVVAIPHPFDGFRPGLGKKLEGVLDKIDAIEVFNSRMLSSEGNDRARRFAEKHRLGMTGGSDAHSRGEVGNAFTYAKARNLDEFKKAILNRKTKVSGIKSGLFVHAKSYWARIRNRM